MTEFQDHEDFKKMSKLFFLQFFIVRIYQILLNLIEKNKQTYFLRIVRR